MVEEIRQDGRVFFFTDAKTLKLPDDELITELKEDNPEWFN